VPCVEIALPSEGGERVRRCAENGSRESGAGGGGCRRSERVGRTRRKSPGGGSRIRTAGGKQSRRRKIGVGWALFTDVGRVKGREGD